MKISLWADDYGYNETVVETTRTLAKEEKIEGYSVLITHVKKVKPIGGIKMGLHVNLTEGRPISKLNTVRTLVNKRGEFYSLPVLVMRVILKMVSSNDVGREVLAQYDRARKLGFNPVVIDSHQHVQVLGLIDREFEKLARTRSLAVRNYKNTSAITLRGRICLFSLKIAAKLTQSSALTGTRENVKIKKNLFFSWESKIGHRELQSMNLDDVRLICHPGLPYDNTEIGDLVNGIID